MPLQPMPDRSAAPYYDDFDSSKQYTQLLALPGRVAQSREFTQMQTVMKHLVKGIGDSIMKDGNIIEGCQVLVNEEKTSAKVTSGKIYLNGMVLPVAETDVDITGSGTETIGAKLVEYLVTEADDPTLKDPALGVDNYGQAGCYRIKSTVEIVVNDTESAILTTLVDGDIAVENYAPEYDVMTQTLARRTFDESGSYIVDGLQVRAEARSDDPTKYNVVIESGKAYVLGYELRIPTARRIVSDRSLTTNSVNNIGMAYSTGTNDYSLYSTHPFVESITRVTGPVRKVEQKTIGSNTSRQQLAETPVTDIISVYQDISTPYTKGTDYELEPEGNVYYIRWKGTQNTPANGDSYTIEYLYTKEFSPSTDYELVQIGNGHYIRWKTTTEGQIPYTHEGSGTFYVDYSQYLARRDLVYMDKFGNLSILLGTPAQYGLAVLPEAPIDTLVLAYIYNAPNGTVVATASTEAIEITNVGLTRYTMRDIQSIVDRLQTIEYDQALLSLDNEAINDVTSGKKGVYTDPLVDLSRIDFYFNVSDGIETDEICLFDMAVDLVTSICYLPVLSTTNNLTYDSSSSESTSLIGRLITLSPTGESVLLKQSNATKSFLINPYTQFPQTPEISIDPATDSWYDDTIIEVPVSVEDTKVVNMSTRTVDNRSSNQINNRNYKAVSKTTVSETAIGTTTSISTTESVISSSAVEYIRSRDIIVTGNAFPEGLDNIKCYFDGKLVALTPISPTVAGTDSGTVMSNSNGYFKAKFTIPSGVRCGSREVLLKSDITRSGYLSEAFTLYIAEGTKRNIQRTVTTVTTVLMQRTTTKTITATYVDPVGQTFVLDRMSMIKGIEVYFENKPNVNTPITMEIREVINGNITPQVYARKTLYPADINISNKASIATRFEFDDPVLLSENTEYAFTLRSTSNAYTAWIAEIGEIEISTKGTSRESQVLKNPYLSGVMMSSSNNSSWTTHQTADLKFNIIGYIFDTSGTAYFDQINLSSNNFSRLLLLAESAIPDGTTINWDYSVDNGVTYAPIAPDDIMVFNSLKSNAKIRARITGNRNLSPMIALDTLAITTSCYDNVGYYTMKNIGGVDGYTNIKVIVDLYEPTDETGIDLYYTKNGSSFTQLTRQASPTVLDYGWKEVIFTGTTAAATDFRLIMRAHSNSNAITPAFRRLRIILS